MSTIARPFPGNLTLVRTEASDGVAWLDVCCGEVVLAKAWQAPNCWLVRTSLDDDAPAERVPTEDHAVKVLTAWALARDAARAATQERIESRWRGMGAVSARPRTEAQQRQDRVAALTDLAARALRDCRGDVEHAADRMAALLVGEPDRDALLPVVLVLLAEVAP